MTSNSVIEETLNHLDNSRIGLLMTIETLPDEALLEPGAVGDYSVADLLAIQTSWEAELVTGFLKIDRKQKPERLLEALNDPADFESEVVLTSKDRSLETIFDDYQGVRIQLENWLEEFSPRGLSDRKRYPFLKGKSLLDLIIEVAVDREKQASQELEQFANHWNQTIPLDMIIPGEGDGSSPTSP